MNNILEYYFVIHKCFQTIPVHFLQKYLIINVKSANNNFELKPIKINEIFRIVGRKSDKLTKKFKD